MFIMPAPSAQETVVTADSVSLHVERFTPSTAPAAALVFVHGFSAHIGNFRHLGHAAAQAGFATTLFDCRGHGHSQGRRGHVDRFGDFVADLDLVIAGARALNPAVPLALAGHSHGALICLEYLLGTGPHPTPRLTRPTEVRALAMAAPFLDVRVKIPAIKRALATPLGHLWPTLAMGNGLKGEDVSRTREVQLGFFTDPLIHHVATSRWFNEARAAQARVMHAAAALRWPTLILMAGQDRVVSNDATLQFARTAGPIVELKVYDNLFHEMFLEPERDQVISDLLRWTAGKLNV
jgi:alpha-beta hydrolase superfamily lysophospholipase